MEREKALSLVEKYVHNKNSIKHMLAVEAVMRELAKKFGENEEIWGIAGLVHDIDMEIVDYRKNPELHGKKGAIILEEEGFSPQIIDAAIAHNKETGKERKSLLEKAIYCTDPLTGLIVASVLISPSRKIKDLSADSVLKRFKEKSFARGAERDVISDCKEINISLQDFIQIGLFAMKKISNELEL